MEGVAIEYMSAGVTTEHLLQVRSVPTIKSCTNPLAFVAVAMAASICEAAVATPFRSRVGSKYCTYIIIDYRYVYLYTGRTEHRNFLDRRRGGT
jgi:hypothetical protein